MCRIPVIISDLCSRMYLSSLAGAHSLRLAHQPCQWPGPVGLLGVIVPTAEARPPSGLPVVLRIMTTFTATLKACLASWIMPSDFVDFPVAASHVC